MEHRFVSTRQVADLCRVHPSTIIRWIDEGMLAAHRTPGGWRRVRMDDLVRFAAAHRIPLLEEPVAPLRVLVVDDDDLLVRGLLQGFATVADRFDAMGTTSGIEALMTIGRKPPDVVVLDVFIPDLDGLEVCRRVRADPACAGVDIVAITGKFSAEVRRKILAAGARICLEKPVRLGDLLQAIESGRAGTAGARRRADPVLAGGRRRAGRGEGLG